MSSRDSGFVDRLRETFRLEAEEHVRALSNAVLEMEKCSTPERRKELVETAFREVHSLKGAARAVHLPAIEQLCQSLESAFSALKRRQTPLSDELLRALDASVGALGKLLPATMAGSSALPSAAGVIEQLTRALELPDAPVPPVAETAPAPPAAAAEPRTVVPEGLTLADNVRLPVARLNALMLQAEELRAPKLMVAQRAAELRELAIPFHDWKNLRSRISPELRQLRQQNGPGGNGNGKLRSALASLLDFIDQTDHTVGAVEDRLQSLAGAADLDQRTLSSMVDTLLDDVRRSLMLPMSSLLEGFPRLVRDLARDAGKRAELEVHGAEIEADRRILQELKTPLVHLMRNVIDHGIETAEERARAGKPAAGKVRIAAAALEGDKFVVLVEDDGRGIDSSRTREAAVRTGLISQEHSERLDEQQSVALIFESGVTTNPIITDLSGRGLGLAIVREKLERLGGTVTATSGLGAGTSFRMELPLTLTTFRGLVVRVNDASFVVPAVAIERVLRAPAADIRTVENRETLLVDGRAVSLLRLGEVLGATSRPPGSAADAWTYAVLLAAAGKRMAFAVDEIVGEQEVVVKSLGRQLARVRNVAGATVLSSGKVVPILHVADLMKSAVELSPGRVAAREGEPLGSHRHCILVAEDSITARALLKNILESAGYEVKTSVDGAEAFTLLKTEEFDLLVSDVEMPRLNGFDLTAKVRADKALAELPVVLVTALESREDRERGIDAGASAYIVKSSFDHSNLLEVVGRLL